MSKQDRLTFEMAHERLAYDPDTGIFTWKMWTPASRGEAMIATKHAGKRAGSGAPGWYRQISIARHAYREHRLAWFMMTGRWPAAEIDHIDGDKANNAWGNLREATRAQNQFNVSTTAANTSGCKGAVWIKKSCKWRAQIKVRGKNSYLGYYDTLEEAHAAYVEHALKLHGQFARTT